MQKQLHPSSQDNQYHKAQDTQNMKSTLKSTGLQSKLNKGRNRLKASREGRSSRSRSSSSYCEAGCLRKSTFKNQNKKLANIASQQTKKSNQSKVKLFNAIQKFYTNLSSMPLDLLITHNSPQCWLKQQHETCNHLKQKLHKLHLQSHQKQNKNTLNHPQSKQQQLENIKLKQEQYQYYVSKLEAISGVLVNIENNIGMLNNLYQQQLRNYTSSSSLGSCTNSKNSSNQKNGQYLMENSPVSSITSREQPKNINRIPTYKQSKKQKPIEIASVPIISSKQYKKQQSMYQIKDMDTNMYTYGTLHNCSQDSRGSSRDNSQDKDHGQSNSSSQHTQNIGSDIYEKMLKKFNQNLNKFATINTNANSRNPKKQQSTYGNSLQPQINQDMGQFLSTCRSQQSPEHHKMQSPSEEKSSIKNSEERTKRISGVSHGGQIQSLSELLALSLVNCTQNGSARDVQQMKTMLKKLTNTWKIGTTQRNLHESLKQEENIRSFKNTKNYEQSALPTSVPVENIKPLLSEITELKQQLHEKNKQIENLLANQQEMQSIIELYKKNDKEAREKSIYAGERIKNLENMVSKYEKQIVKYQNIDMEMRESLKNQVNFVNSLQRQKEVSEKKLRDQVQVVMKLKREIEHMKMHYNEEIQKLRKNQSIAIEKMDIYKQKYYQIVHEEELKKIVLNNTYQGKAGKVKEIWGILNEHRKNLHALDDEEEEEQPSNYKKLSKNRNKNLTPSQKSFQQSELEHSSPQIPIKSTLSQKNSKKFQQKYKAELNRSEQSP